MKQLKNKKIISRQRRHKKIRAKILVNNSVPRLAVFKSNKYIYAQVIDDVNAKTIASVSSIDTKGKTFMEKAKAVGLQVAKLAIEKNIEKVVFDRGGFVYIGRIKAVADGAREGGLKF
jgi:large subunit ribosomal protein L18